MHHHAYVTRNRHWLPIEIKSKESKDYVSQFFQSFNGLHWLLFLALFLTFAVAAMAKTIAFTYQGKLAESGNAANAVYDMQFRLFDNPVAGRAAGRNIYECGRACDERDFHGAVGFRPGGLCGGRGFVSGNIAASGRARGRLYIARAAPDMEVNLNMAWSILLKEILICSGCKN